MTWPIQYFHYIPAPSSIIEMMPGALKVMTQCAAVKPGENVVIACDTHKMRIAEVLASAAYAVGGIPTIVMFPPTGAHGRQVPKPAVGACAQADVFFLPTAWSMTHTDARVEAIKHGARGMTMCEVTEDVLCTGGIKADFEECDRLGRRLGAILSKSKTIRMSTPEGTDLKGEITGRPVQYETGLFREPGQFAAVPNSEINIAPIEGTTEGVIVGNVLLMGYGVIPDEPVTIHVHKGRVTEIEGGKAANYLRETLAAFNDPNAYNLAEFGIGLNPCCRPYSTNLDACGRLGQGHHGFGSNYAIGGKIWAPCHIDISYINAIVEFDGKVVLDKGKVMV
jgi:leucyl aminopeptidase (aminopeptidase T)